MPYRYARRYGDIQRVFRTILRYLKAIVTHVNDVLSHPFHLVAEDDGKWG